MPDLITRAKAFLAERYADHAHRYSGDVFVQAQNNEAAEEMAEALWGAAAMREARTALGHAYGAGQ